MSHEGATRREFMAIAALGGCASVVGLGGCATAPRIQGLVRSGEVVLSRQAFELAVGEGRGAIIAIPNESETVLLMKADGGALAALSGRCTHQKCQVQPGNGFIRCPCHGSTFELDGSVVRGPARRPLPRYEVAVVGDEITIRR